MQNYPGGSIKSPEWQAIRAFIRARAGDCCEECGVGNGWAGVRMDNGVFLPTKDYIALGAITQFGKVFRIVCTVAHVDHDLANNHETNLRFLCQKHHLTHDAAHHASNARATRAARVGQGVLV